MISFKNNIEKSTLSFKVIVVCLLLSGSLVSPGFANGDPAPCYTVVEPPVANVSFKALTSNVVTLTTDTNHGFGTNDSVTITGVGAPFDGVYTIIEVGGVNPFTYAKTAADVVSVASVGVASLGRVLTDGFTCSGSLVIDNSVTSIAAEAFSTNTLLTSVTIPNSVTSIGEQAFYNNSVLTSVTIPNSVTSIGGAAFSSNSLLNTVTIGNSVTSMGDEAFSKNPVLTSVTILNGVTTIGHYAFYENFALRSVTIPDSVTSIGVGAFKNNTLLTSVTIGSSVTSIGANAFRGNTALTAVTIPDSVTSIGNDAFRGNTALTSVNIGNSVASIGNGVFQGNTALTAVTIPDSVTEIGASAFLNSNVLASVTFLGIAALTNAVVGDGAFSGVAVGAIANVAYNATGFGSTWNGLIVRYASAPAVDSGSSSPNTVVTIAPAVVKTAAGVFNLKNKRYLSKNDIKTKLSKNRSFKRNPEDLYKYSIFKTSKKTCILRGNYVMGLKKNGACEMWVTRTTAKGAKYKYWVKIDYSN